MKILRQAALPLDSADQFSNINGALYWGGVLLSAERGSGLIWIPLSLDSGVLGIQSSVDLKFGVVAAKYMGFAPPYNCMMQAISMIVDTADLSRQFRLEIIRDPSGAAVIEDELELVVGQRIANRIDYHSALAKDQDYGARLKRIAGAGDSSFRYVNVLIGVRIT